MADYPDFTITALLKGLFAGDPKALAVDVDGNLAALIKGWYGTTPTPLQVDEPGNLIAMLKALNVAAPINVQADEAGNLQITLVAQEIEEIVNRFKYGAPGQVAGSQDIDTDVPVSLMTQVGKGQIYVAYIYCYDSDFEVNDKLIVRMDGEQVFSVAWETLRLEFRTFDPRLPASLIAYDPVSPRLRAALVPGYTFESGFELQYLYAGGGTVTIGHDVIYSLIEGVFP